MKIIADKQVAPVGRLGTREHAFGPDRNTVWCEKPDFDLAARTWSRVGIFGISRRAICPSAPAPART